MKRQFLFFIVGVHFPPPLVFCQQDAYMTEEKRVRVLWMRSISPRNPIAMPFGLLTRKTKYLMIPNEVERLGACDKTRSR
jgi:hypothetical protein